MRRNRITVGLAAATGSLVLAAVVVGLGGSPGAAAANDNTGTYTGTSSAGVYGPDGRTDSAYLPGNRFDDWAATGAVAGATLPASVNSVSVKSNDSSYIVAGADASGVSSADGLVKRLTSPSGRSYIRAWPSQTPKTGLLVFDLLIQGGTWDPHTETLADEWEGSDWCNSMGMALWSDNTTMTCFAAGNSPSLVSAISVPYFDNLSVPGAPAITVRIRPMSGAAHQTYTVLNQGSSIRAPRATQYACALCSPGVGSTPGGGTPGGGTPGGSGGIPFDTGSGADTGGRQPAVIKALVAKSPKLVDRSTKAKLRYTIRIVNAGTHQAATGKVRLLVNGKARTAKRLHAGAATLVWDPPKTFRTGRTVVRVAYLGDTHTKPARSAKRIVRITR